MNKKYYYAADSDKGLNMTYNMKNTTITGDNVDDVRAAIMALENAPQYDGADWAAIGALINDRPAMLADFRRRQKTAAQNAGVLYSATAV